MYSRRKEISSRIRFLSLFVWLGAGAPVLADGATRDLPDLYYCPGEVLTVSITTDAPPGTVVVILEDHPPDGWSVGIISDGGSYDSVNHAVKWGPWYEDFSRMVTYEVTPPGGATGAQCFDGDVSFNGDPWISIGGDECLAVCSVPTVSDWGLIILATLLTIAGTILFRSRRAVAAYPEPDAMARGRWSVGRPSQNGRRNRRTVGRSRVRSGTLQYALAH